MNFQLFEVVPQYLETLFISFPIKMYLYIWAHSSYKRHKGGAGRWSEFGLFSKLRENPEKRHQALL